MRTRHDEKIDMFVACRTLRHSWEPTATGTRRPEFGTLVCLSCTRCGMLRYDKFSRITGERIGSPSYVYPDGYQGVGKHSIAWWRATWADTVYEQGYTVEAERKPTKPARKARPRKTVKRRNHG